MPCTAFIGLSNKLNMGNGKTATLTRFLIEDWKNGYTIFSNYSLFGIPYVKVNSFQELISLLPKFKNSAIGVDELQVWWDCYSTPNKKDGTKDFKNFARQVRKRNVQLYYTAQCFSDIPNALRKITQNIYMVSKYHNDGSLCTLERCFNEHWVQICPIYPNKSGYDIGNPIYYKLDTRIFDMYDTNEIIGFNNACEYTV